MLRGSLIYLLGLASMAAAQSAQPSEEVFSNLRYRYIGPVGNRVAVIWDRVITPNGIDVNMASPGIDNLGGAGLPGYYNAHWGQRIGAALLISMLSDAFSYEAAEHGQTWLPQYSMTPEAERVG